jgi:phage terminase large subunit GpA-like protein
MAYLSANEKIYRAIARALEPRRHLSVSEWADENRILSSKSSPEPGKWRTDRTPFLREPMDCFSTRSNVKEVVLKFCIQIGKSEVISNVTGYQMVNNPSPIMIAFPAEVSLTKFLNKKLNPLVEECKAVKDVLTSTASRESSNTKTFKDFLGGQLSLEHAGSPDRLKSESIKIMLVDEMDSFSQNINVDDSVDLLLGRLSAFESTYKILFAGSPDLEETSRIDALFIDSDQRKFYVPCPHCNHEQPLEFEGLHWNKLNPSVVVYVCRQCEGHIEEHHKTEMLEKGRWVAENPKHKHRRGYELNALYHPIGLGIGWVKLVDMWLKAQGDEAKKKTFTCDRLARAYINESMKKVKLEMLSERAEMYRLRLAPLNVCVITAAMDLQNDRLEIQVVGWGIGLTAWILDYVVFSGDPNDPEVWDNATIFLNTPIEREDGTLLYIQATAIDTGGHRTQAAYQYVRRKRIKRPMAIKGASTKNAEWLSKGKLLDVTIRGTSDRFGITLYSVGTVKIKDELFSRISKDSERDTDDRKIHFSDELDEDYFGGIVSETKDPKTGLYVKKRGAKRNEPLDTLVYNYAATHHPELRLHRYSEEKWKSLAGKTKTAPIGATEIQAPERKPKKSPFIPD